jgi:Putative Flp pilus-assembly TadE/G-like
MLRRTRHLLARFGKSSDGSILPIFALALIPIVGAVGVAVDYSRAENVRAALQMTLDSAVIAAAVDNTTSYITAAEKVFAANLSRRDSTVGSPGFTLESGSVYAGTVTATVPVRFMGLFGNSAIPVRVNAKAKPAVPENSCILTLDHGQALSHVSVQFNGSPSITLSGCVLRSNTSLDCSGHDSAGVASIAAGTATDCSKPKSNSAVLPDIYAALASNITYQCGASTGGVTWNAGTIPTGANVKTVAKGTYTEYHICGDLTVSGTGFLTGSAPAADSVIIIENGSLNVTNGAVVETKRATIVLAGNNSQFSSVNFPNGNGKTGTLKLSPSIDAGNPWRGMALYQDPALTNHVDNTWGPGATLVADGVIYLPKSNVVTNGNASSNNAHCTKLVTNSLRTNGSLTLNFEQVTSGCDALGVKQTIGRSAALVY